jgi:two-component system chemotaxis response regulator CheY
MARLFLCDDDADYRTLLRAVLADSAHEVVGESCDGRECLDTVADADPEVVLLDLNMPRMSGYEALPELRAALPEAKIFVLSSAKRRDQLDRVLGLGADGYIEKPSNIFTLDAELQAALDAA